VTDYVALNVYDLIQTSMNFSSTKDVIWKRLSIPTAVDDRAYTVALSNVSGGYMVTAWIDTEPFITASSIIPLDANKQGNIQVNYMKSKSSPDGYLFKDGSPLGSVIVKTKLTSGSSLPIVWIQVISNSTYAGAIMGLGWAKG
jgi:hypothetical protein